MNQGFLLLALAGEPLSQIGDPPLVGEAVLNAGTRNAAQLGDLLLLGR